MELFILISLIVMVIENHKLYFIYSYTIPLMGILFSFYRITDTISISGKLEKIVSIGKFYQSLNVKIGSLDKTGVLD